MPKSKPLSAQSDSPYRLRQHFMSTPEVSLFHVLQEMVEERYIICPKVALTDIFTIIRPNENVHFYNKIFRKHVDFLLCDPQTLNPAMGIELITPNSKNEMRPRDQFIEDLFSREGIPLVHIPLGDNYEVSDLVSLFTSAVLKVKNGGRKHATGIEDSVPACPVCGKMMVLRIHRDGIHAGREYYGCMDSPRCDGRVPID